jgi:tetratricopeptide (TPR) repeat protein
MQVAFNKQTSATALFEKKLNEYLMIAKNAPEDIAIHIKLAELYLKNNNKDKALSEYLFAAQKYEEKKLYQIAISTYHLIISIDPEKTYIYTSLADIYIRNGFNGDAVSILERLAHYYYERNLLAECIETLNKILDIDPDNEIFKLKVKKFIENKELLSSEKLINFSRKNPSHQAQGQNSFQSLIKKASYDFFDLEESLQGDDSYTLTSDHEPQEETVFFEENHGQQKPYDDIFAEIKQINEQASESALPDFYYNLGIAHMQVKQFENAIEDFKRAIACIPKFLLRNIPSVIKSADCYIQIVKCCKAVEKPDMAEHYLKMGLVFDTLSYEENQILLNELDFLYKETPNKKSYFWVLKKKLLSIKYFFFLKKLLLKPTT